MNRNLAAKPSGHAPDHGAPLDHATIRSIIIGIMLAMLLGALDQTIVITAMPTIGRELSDAGALSWIITAYLLTSTAVTPLYGKFSDIYGRRVMMLIAISVFVAGSIGCALAPDMLVLIVMRGIQGLGGGGLISLAQTIIADVVSPRERSRYQGYIAGVFATSSIGGPVLGGMIAEYLHWSLIFWINLPLGGLALYMTASALRRLPRHERRHRIDVIGAVLMVMATIPLLLALTWGGTVYPWGSVQVLGLLALSVLTWMAFSFRMATAPEPFLPISILSNAVVRNAALAAFFAMGTLIGLSMFVPMYLEAVGGYSAGDAGLVLISLMLGVVVTATVAGRAMSVMTHYKRLSVGGAAVSALALVAMAVFPGSLPTWVLVGLLTLIGLGIGTVLPVTTVSLQNAVPVHQLGTATGTMNFFRSLGSSLMVAMMGAIFFSSIEGAGGKELHLETLAADMVRAGRDLPGVFGWVFAAAAAGIFAGLCFIIAMEERPLRSSIHLPAEAGAGE